MKKLYFFLVLLFPIITYSQTSGFSLRGNVTAVSTKQAIPDAEVLIINKKNTVIAKGLTDVNGQFVIHKLPLNQNLQISIHHLSFQSTLLKLAAATTKTTKELHIKLTANNTVLNDVSITAQKKVSTYSTKQHKHIINVTDDLLANGGNSLQLLQNLPGIDVNLQSGAVSLRGSANVTVLINGKPSNLSTQQLLRQTPANMIKQVEIITSPSAKYIADGTSGLVNLILKKQEAKGFNSSLVLGVEHSKNTRPSSYIDVNYRRGNTNIYGNFNFDFGKTATLQELNRSDQSIRQQFDFLHDYKNYSFKLGSDFVLDADNTISLYTYQSISNSTLTTNGTTEMQPTNLVVINNSHYRESEQVYNFDYLVKLPKEGAEFEMEMNYSISKNPEDSFNRFPQNPSDKRYEYTNDIAGTTQAWLANADLTYPLTNTSTLEYGIEFRSQNNSSSIVTDQQVLQGTPPVTRDRGTTEFDYFRSMTSMYLNYQYELRDVYIEAGARIEYFHSKGTFSNSLQGKRHTKDDLFSVYPSLSVNWDLDKKNSLQMAFSRRIDRPSMYQLSPIQEWVSPLTTSEGNTALKPQFSNSIEANYTRSIKKGNLRIGSFYRRIDDLIGRSMTLDPNNSLRQLFSFVNYDYSENYGLEVQLGYRPYKWIQLQSRAEAYIQETKGLINQRLENIQNTLYKFMVNSNVTLSEKLSGQLGIYYRARSKNIQFTVAPFTNISAGLNLSVFKDQGSISLRFVDLLNDINYDYSTENPFPQVGNYNLELNSVYLGFNYTFGSEYETRARKERALRETEKAMF